MLSIIRARIVAKSGLVGQLGIMIYDTETLQQAVIALQATNEPGDAELAASIRLFLARTHRQAA